MKASANLAVDVSATERGTEGFAIHRLAGLVIVALLPALFWTVLVSVIASALGYNLSLLVLTGTATAIAVFLGTIYAAITSGSDKA